MLRIDPSMCACIVKVKKLILNGETFPYKKRKHLIVNGTRLKVSKENPDALSLVFSTDDPNINLNLEKCRTQEINTLHVEFEMIRVPAEVAADIAHGAR